MLGFSELNVEFSLVWILSCPSIGPKLESIIAHSILVVDTYLKHKILGFMQDREYHQVPSYFYFIQNSMSLN